MEAEITVRAETLRGHAAAADRFSLLSRRGRLSGTHLFVGPADARADAFAVRLAKAVLCLEPRDPFDACGRCLACVRFDAGSHPDFELVRKPEDRSTIPLDAFIGDAGHRMREGLCWRILLRPALSRRKVAIILDADHLSDEAANCLLKTLEEPPDHAIIILVGTSVERQLPTIRSRCQVLRFRPLEASERTLSTADPAEEEFYRSLRSRLSARPLHGVELAREVTAWVEAAGKEAPARRARLRGVMETAIGAYRQAMRASVDDEYALDRLAITLDAIEWIDANLNVAALIDAWTAMLEEPRLSQAAHLSPTA